MDLHYFWVGPPASGEFLGMDTIGPKLSKEKYPLTDVTLWCLDAQLPHYQQAFATLGIKVVGIESYLFNKNEQSTRLFRLIEEKKERAESVHQQKVDCFREYVTIKEAVQYYLQQEHSGYFLDSNLIPDPAFSGELKALEQFSVPVIPRRTWKDGTRLQFNFSCDLDPWLMYSPENDVGASQRFSEYFSTIQQEHLEFTNTQTINRRVVERAFVETAMSEVCANKDREFFSGNEDVARIRSDTTISFSGFYKRYANSHKVHKGLLFPNFFNLCLESEVLNKEELNHYLLAGLNFFSLIPCPRGQRGTKTNVIRELIIAEKDERLNELLEVLSLERAQEIFSIGHDFSFYCKGAYRDSSLLRLLSFYVDARFDSINAFLETINKLSLALEQLGMRKAASQCAPIESLRVLVGKCFIDKKVNLIKACNVVTRLGPITDKTLESYCRGLRQALEPSSSITSQHFKRRAAMVDEETILQALELTPCKRQLTRP